MCSLGQNHHDKGQQTCPCLHDARCQHIFGKGFQQAALASGHNNPCLAGQDSC